MGSISQEVDDFELKTGITSSDIKRLGRVYLFSGMPPDMLRGLLSTSSIRKYPEGATLFIEGDPADRFFVVMEGWVKLFRLSENGQEVVISVASPGESFAEAAIFDSSDFPVNASAVTPARLLVVNGETMLRQLADNAQLTFNMMASMSRQMRKNVTTLHHMSSMSSTQRLADFLLGLTETPSGPATIVLPLDKSLIAARLGMQPETFSRSLSKLKPVGLTSSGHEIQIKDVGALREFVHNAPTSR